MAFSHQIIRDHGPQWLKERLAEQVADTDFVFHLNRIDDNSGETSRKVLAEIEMPHLQPLLRIATFRG
jgi:hypothetical protein